ncbi:MAG TPA: Yip1 family protein [Candidatus Krumholzibacteria bacterium]|nr:Yip1 family protein [Candidatus Krumholzibacteria bacterium]
MNALNRLVWIFTSPQRVFDDIREGRVNWVQPWLAASVIYAIITWISMPIQRAVLQVNSEMTSEQIDQQMELMEKFGFVWVLLAPVGMFVITFIIAGISYVVVAMASRAANFKKYLTLSFYTGIVGMMGQLITCIIVRLRGLDQIESPADARLGLSLRALAPDNDAVRGILGSFEFFAIWSLVLVVMGLMRIFGMTRGQAIATAVVLWIFYAIATVVGELTGAMG